MYPRNRAAEFLEGLKCACLVIVSTAVLMGLLLL